MSNIEKSCLQSLKKTKQIVCKRDKVKKYIFTKKSSKILRNIITTTETKKKIK